MRLHDARALGGQHAAAPGEEVTLLGVAVSRRGGKVNIHQAPADDGGQDQDASDLVAREQRMRTLQQLDDRQVYYVELAEISKANMHNQYEKVLNILEDDSFPMECKGVDGFELDSLHHFIINSNNMAAVPPGRRYLPIRCSDRYAANLDCQRCKKRMVESAGQELMCKECEELGGYHSENYRAFDLLCAKAFYKFAMALPDVPEKLTATHVRQNEATETIKEHSKDSIDMWLEHWVSSDFRSHFGEETKDEDAITWIAPNELFSKFKT